MDEKNLDQEDDIDFMERVYEMRGTLLHEQKAYKIAVVDFGKAIALRPNRPENYYFRGSCQCKLGNFERVMSSMLNFNSIRQYLILRLLKQLVFQIYHFC